MGSVVPHITLLLRNDPGIGKPKVYLLRVTAFNIACHLRTLQTHLCEWHDEEIIFAEKVSIYRRTAPFYLAESYSFVY